MRCYKDSERTRLNEVWPSLYEEGLIIVLPYLQIQLLMFNNVVFCVILISTDRLVTKANVDQTVIIKVRITIINEL